jgi:uncharacterized protein (DUF2126 family)
MTRCSTTRRRWVAADVASAQTFAQRLAARLGVKQRNVAAGFEDVLYYLWKEGTLPENVDVLDSKLDDKLERERLRRLFERGLDQVVGYALPLGWDHAADRWTSSPWTFRRGHMFLLPGDSPMGLRLPLDALVWEKPELRQRCPGTRPVRAARATACRSARGYGKRHDVGDVAARYASWQSGLPPDSLAAHGLSEQGLADAEHEGPWFVRTAMAFEPRDGNLHVFLPPLEDVAHWLDLVAAIEDTARELGQAVVLEGYPAPHDPRLKRFSVTPDPGVIEVNIHPARSWHEMVNNTEVLVRRGPPVPAGYREVHARRSAHGNRWRQPCHPGWPDAGRQPDPAQAAGPEQPAALLAEPPGVVVPVLGNVHRPDLAGAARRRGA